MPCKSDYPELTNIESSLNSILNIYDDLVGEYRQFKWPHPKLLEIDCTESKLNKETENLCCILSSKSRNEITSFGYITQRWWLKHQIEDFKRLTLENSVTSIYSGNYSKYEKELFEGIEFLNYLIDDPFEKITNRFLSFNSNQNTDWQTSITKTSFVQVMSSFELFSEVVYYKINKREIPESINLKNYKISNSFWRQLIGEGYENCTDQSAQLIDYFEKYEICILPNARAKSYYEATFYNNDRSRNLCLTKIDSQNAMKILGDFKSIILREIFKN